MQRIYTFSIDLKRVIKTARELDVEFKSVREAERVLKSVSESVNEKLDGVVEHFVKKFVSEYGKTDELSKAVDSASEDSDSLPEESKSDPVDAAQEEVEPKVEEVAEQNQEKSKNNKYECPVCGRNSSSKKRFMNHVKAQAKKCYKHAEYLQTLK